MVEDSLLQNCQS